MSEPREDSGAEPPKPEEKRADDAPSKGDLAAIGIGCLVLVIFFIAIVIVGATRE